MITVVENSKYKSLFQVAMGPRFYDMPPILQELHGPSAAKVWQGQARTKAGGNWLSRFIAKTVGLNVPHNRQATSEYEPLQVKFDHDENSERWTRDFNGHAFNSHFTLGMKSDRQFAIENFGLFKFELDLVLENDRLNFVVKRCTFLGLPMPPIFLPKGDSHEYERNGRFHFNVEVRVPVAGLIAAYDGWLEPLD